MGRKKEVQELADRILKDSRLWTSISEFKGDWTLFSEEVVRNALADRIQSYEEASEITEIIMSDSELGTCKELLATLIDTVTYDGAWHFVEDVLKYARDDVLIGPIRDWFLEYLRTGSEGTFWIYIALSKHPQYKENPQFIEALKDHKHAITDAVREMDEPVEVLGPLAEHLDIIYSDRVLDALVDWICNDIEACLYSLMECPAFSKEKEIWNQIYPRLEKLEIGYWRVEDAFDSTSLLIRENTKNEDIHVSRKKLTELIELNGWPLMRLSVLSEMHTAKQFFENDEFSGEELEETRQRFFKLLGLEDLIGFWGDPRELLDETRWKGSLEQLSKDIFDNAFSLLEKEIKSGGSTLEIDITKLKHTRASKLIPDILEMRKHEMESIEIIIHNKLCVDLRLLWDTGYGSEILKTKKVWKFCSIGKLKEIQKALEELGYFITIKNSEDLEPSGSLKHLDNRIEVLIRNSSSNESITLGLEVLNISQHPEAEDITRRITNRQPDLQFNYEDIQGDIRADADFQRTREFFTGTESLEQLCRENRNVIDLSNRSMTTCDLTPLKQCTYVKEIVLTNNAIYFIDLSPLSDCEELESLILSKNKLRELDLTPLSSCTNLKKLVLHQAGPNSLVPLDLTPLSDCLSLEELDLSYQFHSMASIDLSPLSSLAKLKKLILTSTFTKEIDLNPLSGCESLEVLDLGDMMLSKVDLTPLSKCTNLHTLFLRKNDIRQIDLAPLQGCTELKSLNFSANRHTSIDLTPLKGKKKLEFLIFNSLSHMELNITSLLECPAIDYFAVAHPLRNLNVKLVAERAVYQKFKGQIAEPVEKAIEEYGIDWI